MIFSAVTGRYASMIKSPTHAPETIETEVKFYLRQPQAVRSAILALGARGQERVFETNIRFEDRRMRLIKNRMLLRLRKDAGATLTFKSPPVRSDPQFKMNNELEVQVSDFSTMYHILTAVGFHEAQRYEKWRETFTLGKTHFCMDTLPYGDFLEIEGEKGEILEFSRKLGMQWDKRIVRNYLEIFQGIKQALNLPFSDITFDDFNGVHVELEEIFPEF